MTRVNQLIPGDVVESAGREAVFVASHTPHPLWPHLALVVWKLDDGTWSHDALAPAQVIGDVKPSDNEQREFRLRAALLGGVA